MLPAEGLNSPVGLVQPVHHLCKAVDCCWPALKYQPVCKLQQAQVKPACWLTRAALQHIPAGFGCGREATNHKWARRPGAATARLAAAVPRHLQAVAVVCGHKQHRGRLQRLHVGAAAATAVPWLRRQLLDQCRLFRCHQLTLQGPLCRQVLHIGAVYVWPSAIPLQLLLHC